MPPADCCEYRQRGKALAGGDRTIDEYDRAGGVPIVSMGVACPDRRAMPGTLPMLVARRSGNGDARYHALRGNHVDAPQGPFAVKAVAADLEAMGGYRHSVLKSGQEAPMTALQLHAKRQCSGEVIPQNSTVGQSTSIGVFVVAVVVVGGVGVDVAVVVFQLPLGEVVSQ